MNLRLTIISNDGTVLAESHKNKEEMDNHKYRDEIMQANKESYGYKIRHSSSISKDLLYIAKRYPFKDTYVYLRLAKELTSVNEQIFSLGIKVFIVLSMFFIAIFLIALRTSKEIEQETKKIVSFLKSLTKKQKLTYISSNYSQEFTKITQLLTKVSQILTKKEKQKSKYTAKLQTSNQQKDDIISAISHEFKNPIAVINGYSQTLLEDTDISPVIRQKFLTKVYKNGKKLSDLIDTLRLSIKLDNGQSTITLVPINLYDAIKDAIESLKANYPKREVIINGEKDILLQADDSLFSVILSNLIENAFKYSEDEVVINFDKTRLDVVDSGIGISKENLQNITSKFYRVHENSWNNSLGLGLFLVSNIVSLHNFNLEIQSIEHEGSTFSINY